jgi:hypothetical protein
MAKGSQACYGVSHASSSLLVPKVFKNSAQESAGIRVIEQRFGRSVPSGKERGKYIATTQNNSAYTCESAMPGTSEVWGERGCMAGS